MRVDSLTQAQIDLLPAYRDKWLKVGLDTNPANRAEAEAAVRLAYECGGLLPPKIIVWLRSPLEGAIGAAMFASLKASGRAVAWDQVWAQVRAQVGDQVWAQVRAQVGDQVRDQVRDQVGAQVWDQVRDQVGDQVGDQVRAQVWAQVRAQVGDQVGDQVRAQVRAQVWAQVRAQVRDQVGDQVGDQVRAQVGDQVGDQVRAQVRAQVWRAGYGQHDANWLGFYEFFLEQCGLEAPKRLQGLFGLARTCGWFWPFEGVVILTERPNALNRDAENRLHCEDGPALSYPDGFSLWKWHGVTVPSDVIEHPETITVAQIEAEENAEVRRVMVERYGADRYVVDSGAVVVDQAPEDHPLQGLRTARLLRKDVPGDEPIIFADLLNSTPEPDGSVRRYMLRVSPHAYGGESARNVHAAAASTWRNSDGSLAYKNWRDYAPAAES
ncbi:DUF6745 domain-containing protein [Hydrogenophaga sp.]|uniref:DUF6745 domain-containing protein n=1 Tax=Hydrogenophaga sp. TaxID=1904254 RepID=UPI003F6FFDAC